MTETTVRTAFAEQDGGTGVVIATKRTDFADPEVRAADQAQLLRRVAAHVQNGTTDLASEPLLVDPAEFCDLDRFDDERELFFCRTPQLAAYSAELPGPNTFTTKDIAGVPVLITRDGDGVLHAFRNVCLNHPGSDGGSGVWVSNPGGVGLLGSVERCFELRWRRVAAVAV